MPTVDDLIISLTIKETSKLGKLQKTLEDFQEGRVVQKGFDSGLKMTVQKIKNKLSSLVGRRIATKEQPSKMALQAIALRKDLKEDVRNLAEKLVPQKGVATMMEEFGAETREDLIDAMRDKIDEWIKRLELIISKDWTTESASGFMAAIRDFVSRGDMTDDLRKVFIERVERKIGEFNKEIADLLRSAGIKAISEFKAYILKPEFLKRVVRMTEGGTVGTMLDRSYISKFVGIDLNSPIFKELRGLGQGTKNVTEYIGKAVKKLGIELKPETFTKGTIEKSEELKAIVVEAFDLYQTKYRAKGAVPKGFHNFFRNIIERNFPQVKGKHIFSQIRPDIAILQGDFEKLKTVFNEDISKAISENQIGFIELKQILSESNVDQIKKYEDMLGNITAVASVIKTSFEQILPDIKKDQMNILNKLNEMGVHKVLTDDEVKELQRLAEKELNSERILDIIKAEQKAIQNLSTKEDVDKILKAHEDTDRMIKEKRNEIENLPGEF